MHTIFKIIIAVNRVDVNKTKNWHEETNRTITTGNKCYYSLISSQSFCQRERKSDYAVPVGPIVQYVREHQQR